MDDFDALSAALVKAIGVNFEDTEIRGYLSTGYLPLNHAVSGKYRDGGLPQGRIIEIFGPESSGKTAIATEAMISAQRLGGVAAFMDHERSWDGELADSRGLNMDKGWILKRPKTFEDSILMFMNGVEAIRTSKTISKTAPICWVFDSLASMIPQSQFKTDLLKQGMGDKLALAQATSLHLKVVAHFAEEFNVCTIFLNQTREKPGVMFGDPTTTPGGKAPRFYSSVRIQLGATRLMKKVKEGTEETTVMVGSEIKARCVKNKIYRPWMSAKWKFMFREDGTGFFDNAGSLIDLLITKGLLEKKKNFITWDGKQWNSMPALAAHITSDPASMKRLEDILIEGGVGAEVEKPGSFEESETEALVTETE